jgi:hypothetical protein
LIASNPAIRTDRRTYPLVASKSVPNRLAEIPDFDSYPACHRIEQASPIPRGVRVRWNDDLDARYHVFWLREHAPDAETTHPVTREQALQRLDIPDGLEAVAAGTDAAGNLLVSWSTGGGNRYHPGWLRA